MGLLEVMQVFDRLKVLKGLSFWDTQESLSCNADFEQYKEFQSIHDNDLHADNKVRKIMKLMICICSEFLCAEKTFDNKPARVR